jgi:hypothetical protein
MTVVPGQKGTAGIGEVPDPSVQDGALLVRGMAVGICGTDREIAEGVYDTPPSGEAQAGHRPRESRRGARGVGGIRLRARRSSRRNRAPARSGALPPCAAGEWDMCRTDSFGERDIVRLHGYGSEHWRVEPDFAVPIFPRLSGLGVLLEPASAPAKAWDQVDQISRRAFFLRGEVPRGHPAPRGCRVPLGSAALLCQQWSVPGIRSGGWHANGPCLDRSAVRGGH